MSKKNNSFITNYSEYNLASVLSDLIKDTKGYKVEDFNFDPEGFSLTGLLVSNNKGKYFSIIIEQYRTV